MNLKKFTILLLLSFSFSQFNNIQITLEHNNMLSENELYKIENLEREINNYFKFNKFCQEYDFIDIKLNIQLIIESISTIRTSRGTMDQIKSHLYISNAEDQHYFSKSIHFEYNKNKTFIFNPYKFEGIESVFNYYAYLFIGYELDKWSTNLGTTYFNKALEVSYEGGKDSKWKNRKDEIKDIIDNVELRKIRALFYSYIGIINSNNYSNETEKYNADIKTIFIDIYNNLYSIYKKYGQDKNTLKFLNYHSSSLAEVYSFFNMEDIILFLASYDNENKDKYLEHLN